MKGGLGTQDAHGGIERRLAWRQRVVDALRGTRVVVLGGAGFLGSHLTEALLGAGAEVVVVDNLITGDLSNLKCASGAMFVEGDICNPIAVEGPVDFVVNLASIAAPPTYTAYAIETLRAGSVGVQNALDLASRNRAVYLQASTSEVYGDPTVNPQTEHYWGNVNPVGPRSMYDESKRFAEALTMAYADKKGLDVRIARIFNTYGPRMGLDDGRAIPAFIRAAFAGLPLPVHGDGMQTRSLCFVDDLIEGLLRLLVEPYRQPVNLGSTEEVTILDLAERVIELSGSSSTISFEPRPGDDPQRRRPDTTLAHSVLDFDPAYSLDRGLAQTIVWFADHEGYRLVIDLTESKVKVS